MPFSHLHAVLKNVRSTARRGFGSILKDPSILAYPLLATLFVALTYAGVSGVVLHLWRSHEPQLAKNLLGSAQNQVPHAARDKLGIVTFYYFYTAIVTAYFTCAVAGAVWAKLDGHPTTVFHGLGAVLRRFGRVSYFAVLSIFFVPMAVIAQWRKLPRGFIGVIGSSFALNTSNLAPTILNKNTRPLETIRVSVKTLGAAWRESLVIKIMSWLSIAVLGAISFLPNYIQHYHFPGDTARWVAWITSTALAATFFVLTKVISGVMLTVLFYDAEHHPEKYR